MATTSCERLAGGAQPRAIADLVREVLDLVEHLPHLWHHIRSICVDFLQRQTKTVTLMRSAQTLNMKHLPDP